MDELIQYIKVRARAAGVNLDTYDADFLLGVITAWLHDHDSVLTEHGVRRVLDS